MAFGCWFSFFNGVTQSAHNLYPKQVLGIALFVMLALRTGMRVGQLAISPWMGSLADRWGNRPVMGEPVDRRPGAAVLSLPRPSGGGGWPGRGWRGSPTRA